MTEKTTEELRAVITRLHNENRRLARQVDMLENASENYDNGGRCVGCNGDCGTKCT